MKPDELERLAHAGGELPPMLPMEEQMFFLSMRALYAQYRAGTLPKEQAIAEKQLIFAGYTAAKAVFDDTRRLAKLFPETIRATELDRALFHKEKRAGAAADELLAIACRIIRAATGDKTF
jgi:hypothetical protein